MSRSRILTDDILEMISRIEDSVKKVGANFHNVSFYDSTLMRLQVIGESIKKLPKEELKKYTEVDWNVFIKFREVVSHSYFRISHRILNDMIANELPKLKKAIKKIGGKS
ncbi:MAG: DUF86 domain-containing protein [Nanoarchaeota archaeon]|nr:DUF86 domain-containing protein [Nanoarchaeota archaeon]